MRREDEVRLRHMRDAAREAIAFVEGRKRSDLDADRQLLLAIAMDLGILGEAAGRVCADTRDSLPDIPWPLIIGMRNRLIHAYFDLDPDVIWKTVLIDLPGLIAALDRVLGEEES